MASTYVLKICSIIEFFEDEKKMIKRGENSLESNNVKRMQFDADSLIIRGEIHTSMKDKAFNVQITLSKSGDITSATCTYPRGIKCHHIATLALFGHYNISITDKECVWNAPKPKNLPACTAEEMYPPKPYVAIGDSMSEETKLKLKSKLIQFGNTVGFTWLLQDEVTDDLKDLPVIEDIITSDDFIGAINEKWLLIRKFRLTASNFGLILSACKRNRYPESLFKTLLGTYNLDGIKSIQWGRNHE